MIDDPIVAEVCRAREAYAKQFHYDMEAMIHDLRKRQYQWHQVISFPPKRPQPVERTISTAREHSVTK